MDKTAELTDQAKFSLEEITAYLRLEISELAAERLLKNVALKSEWVCKYPEAGQLSSRSMTVRWVKIDKHRKVFYRALFTTVFILDFFDTRQDPENSPY